MADDLHDVVKLLLKRMESHPEEFDTGPTNRWGWIIADILGDCSEEEADAIKKGLRPIRLQELHETVMDELLNGDERRRREIEEQEYEKRTIAQHASNMQQAMRISANGSVGIGSVTPSHPLVVKTPARHPTSTDMERSGIMDTLRNIMK